MNEAKPIATPVNTGLKLIKATESDELVDEGLYQFAVGSLQYLSTMTRPDITFAVSTVAKFCSKPTKEHWIAVKRIMRYLKGSINYGLLYRKIESSASFIGFSDSDWAGDVDDRWYSNKLEEQETIVCRLIYSRSRIYCFVTSCTGSTMAETTCH